MFALHPQLALDTHPLTRWRLCQVLLLNDCTYPWLVLVPMRPDVTEIHHLSAPDQHCLIEEIAAAAQGLEQALAPDRRPDKINVGALGNVVPQLHVHVLARFKTDPAWPKPVWGAAPAVPYDDAGRAAMIARLMKNLVMA